MPKRTWDGTRGEFWLVDDPGARVRVIANTIIGLVDGREVSSYVTSGVRRHKLVVVMNDVEHMVHEHRPHVAARGDQHSPGGPAA